VKSLCLKVMKSSGGLASGGLSREIQPQVLSLPGVLLDGKLTMEVTIPPFLMPILSHSREGSTSFGG
jgi:hypothetical protein